MKKANKEDYGLDKNKKLVLIVMGSLGSKTVNDKIVSFLDDFKNKDYQVLFVTGNSYYETAKNITVPKNVIIKPFIGSPMPEKKSYLRNELSLEKKL